MNLAPNVQLHQELEIVLVVLAVGPKLNGHSHFNLLLQVLGGVHSNVQVFVQNVDQLLNVIV